MTTRLFLWGALAASTCVPYTHAAVSLVRDYRLQPPRDRQVVFAMAVIPDQGVLSFIANKDGKWRLSRIHGWFEKEPHEDRTVVPGLVYGDREQRWSPWYPELAVTPDGKFVICVASAWRSQGHSQDEFISVVDWGDFHVVASVHRLGIPALGGIFRVRRLDGLGHLAIQAYTLFPRRPGDDITDGGSQVKTAVLSLPGLAVTDQCGYSERTRTGSPTRREDEGSCPELEAYTEAQAGLGTGTWVLMHGKGAVSCLLVCAPVRVCT